MDHVRGAAVRFAWVALWSGVIFATLPLGPDLVTFVSTTINRAFGTDRGYEVQGWIAAAAVAVVLAVLVGRFIRSPAGRSPLRCLVVAGVVGVYAWLLATLKVPVEKIHFIEYGVLAWLLHRAFDPLVGPAIWPASFFAGAAIGTLDEVVQHLLPNRVGQIDDAALNAAAVGLPLVMGAAISPRDRGPAGPRDRRAVWATGLAAAVAVGAFALIVPEFGIEIDDPRGFRVKTRLASPEALLAADAAVPPEAIDRLRAEDDSTYGAYLRDHPSSRAPFLHQFRVHLYRRDRYLGKGGLDEIRVAWAENRILEAWFPRTLEASGHRWDEDRLADVHARLAAAPAAGVYVSPVGKDIVTLGGPVRPPLEAIRVATPAVVVPLGGAPVEIGLVRNADGAPGAVTRATIAADAGGLRFVFDCADSDLVSTRRGRDAPLWTEDAVEVFVDTEGAGLRYAEIEVSPAGEVFDAAVTFGRPVVFDTSWTAPDLAVETAVVPGGWRADVRIAWRDLGLAGPPPALRLNLHRIDAAPGRPQELFSWSPTRDWFHRPWRFGLALLQARPM